VAEYKTREQRLEQALRDLIRHHRNVLESGRSRIVELGGEDACDPVDSMMRGDPYIRNAEAALARGVPAAGKTSDGEQR
jgi:hypothetical protein